MKPVLLLTSKLQIVLADHPQLLSNVFFVYLSYSLRFVSPLVVVPLLARRLGPVSYGLVQLGTALGLFIALIVEFGFPSSGPREIATKVFPKEVASVVSAISAAKLTMIFPAAMIGFIATLAIPELRAAPVYALGGTLVGIGGAANLTWFWQGRGQMRISTIFDLLASIVYAIAVVFFVRTARHGYAALYCQAGAFLLSSILAHAVMMRKISLRFPTKRQIWDSLHQSMPLFIARAAGSINTTASVLVLGVLSNITQVSYYAAGEKIVILVMSATYPLSQAVFPHVVRQMSLSRPKALKLVRLILAVLAGGTAVVSAVFFLSAAQLIALLYGHRFSPAVAPFKLLVWAIPLATAAQVLNNQLLIPSRHDKWVTISVLVGGIANLAAALILAPRFGAFGMAISRVVSEVVALAIILEVIRRTRMMAVNTDA